LIDRHRQACAVAANGCLDSDRTAQSLDRILCANLLDEIKDDAERDNGDNGDDDDEARDVASALSRIDPGLLRGVDPLNLFPSLVTSLTALPFDRAAHWLARGWRAPTIRDALMCGQTLRWHPRRGGGVRHAARRRLPCRRNAQPDLATGVPVVRHVPGRQWCCVLRLFARAPDVGFGRP
jgi:hypothetical protein